MIRGVLFDATGTLIELREPVGETYARIAAEFGVDLPAWRIDDAFRRIFAQAVVPLFPHAAPDERPALERDWWRGVVRATFLATDSTLRFGDFDAFFERLYAHFSGVQGWSARDGAAETLGALAARGIACAVVSNFDSRLPGLLDALGLSTHLDGVVLPSDAGAAKPDARIFRAALERLGVSAGDAVFVGDDAERDFEGARATGLATIDVAGLATLCDLPARLESGRIGVRQKE